MSSAWSLFPNSDAVPPKRQRRKAATARDPYYVPGPKPAPAKNTTLLAMLMFKNPHCVYCGCKLTYETAELDKNDLAASRLNLSRLQRPFKVKR